jgi:hypothetical protein
MVERDSMMVLLKQPTSFEIEKKKKKTGPPQQQYSLTTIAGGHGIKTTKDNRDLPRMGIQDRPEFKYVRIP